MHIYEFLSESKETVVPAMLFEDAHWFDSDTFFGVEKYQGFFFFSGEYDPRPFGVWREKVI